MRTLRRFAPALGWLVLIGAMGALMVWQDADDSLWALAMLLPFVWLASPFAFPNRTAHAEAERLAAADPRVVRAFVRPGSLWCVVLRWRLRALARQVHWVDIWADPAARELVRELGRGEPLVPVVIAGERARHNPPPHWIAQHLRSDGTSG